MKNYIKILILLLCCHYANAQELPILSTTSLANPEEKLEHADNGNYAIDTNNERDQYVGTWEYNQNGVIFRLKIEKHDQAINKIEYNGIVSSYNYSDEVEVRYKLVKNNITIFDNLNQSDIDNTVAFGIKLINFNYLKGRLLDQTRNVVGSYTIKRLNSTPPKIIFDMERFNYTLKNDPSFYNDGQPLFSIPMGGIEMIKVN